MNLEVRYDRRWKCLKMTREGMLFYLGCEAFLAGVFVYVLDGVLEVASGWELLVFLGTMLAYIDWSLGRVRRIK